MKPAVPETARFLAGMLRADVIPALTGFRAGNVGMTAAMLDMIAEEWDRAADRLVRENDELRPLIERCAAVLGQWRPLPEPTGSLRVEELTRTNDTLRDHLTEIHAALEDDESGAAAALEAEIWDLLRRSVENRRIASANF